MSIYRPALGFSHPFTFRNLFFMEKKKNLTKLERSADIEQNRSLMATTRYACNDR